MKIKNSIFIILLLLISTACDEDVRYHSYLTIPATEWKRNDTLTFKLPEYFDSGKYRVSIGLRHNDAYKYKNLWLEIRDNLTDSTKMKVDTIQLQLADKDGNWKGSGIGGLYQFSKDDVNYLFVKSKGSSYKIRINHIMRDNPLRDINDIGIKLIRISN